MAVCGIVPVLSVGAYVPALQRDRHYCAHPVHDVRIVLSSQFSFMSVVAVPLLVERAYTRIQ